MIPHSPIAPTPILSVSMDLVSVCHEVVDPTAGEAVSSTTDQPAMADAKTRHRVRQATLTAEVELLAQERSSLRTEKDAMHTEGSSPHGAGDTLELGVEDERTDAIA